MHGWLDILTQTTYAADPREIVSIQRHLASQLGHYLKMRGLASRGRTGPAASLKPVADEVASFWSERYPRLIYPLRVTADRSHPLAAIRLSDASPASATLRLSAPWRTNFLEPGSPPLLPAEAVGLRVPPTLLADEWALTASAYALCALALKTDDSAQEAREELAALRLGILLFPVWNALSEAGETIQALAGHSAVRAVAAHLSGHPSGDIPASWRSVLDTVSASDAVQNDAGRTWLLVGNFYRIKQYVFESPRLAQVRGASILLEQVVREAARRVSDAFGPECVVRQAGGSLMALLPVETAEAAREWEEKITSLAYRTLGSVRFSAGSASLPLSSLLPGGGTAFGAAQRRAYQVLEGRRDAALEPMWELLPFEARCDRCGQRAAEFGHEDFEGESISVCAVCRQRESVGRSERRRLIEKTWREVGFEPSAWVVPEPDETGTPNDPVPPSLEKLIPGNRRRRWVAMVYGDGNNFGSLVQRMQGLPEYIHWTRRLYWTVRGLTQLALVGATAFFAESASGEGPSDLPGLAAVRTRYTHYPFEILTLGGDDVAFFAWAPVGLKAVEYLQSSLQHEFAQHSIADEPGAAEHAGLPPVTFSFGVAIGDYHVPVQRFREIAEDVLLKAVKARRRAEEREGRIAFFAAANSGEMTPQRIRQIWRMKKTAANGENVLLSLQPVTARELAFLLEKAIGLSRDAGRLTRLAVPFIGADPAVAVLNYHYTAARARSRRNASGSSGDDIFGFIEAETRNGEDWTLFTDKSDTSNTPVLPLLRLRPGVGGEEQQSEPMLAVPLLDLLQLSKTMQ